MATWGEFAAAEPELAARVIERFAIGKHKTMATLRKDGSPRISGIETQFEDGELFAGMMPGSRKLDDVRRDPRLALHSPSEDPPVGRPSGWRGEAKIAGSARLVPSRNAPAADADRIRVDIQEVVFTHLNDAGDRLVIESWRPERGRRVEERT